MLTVILYIIITFLISWSIWVPQALAAVGIIESAASLTSPLNIVAVWGPGLAAILITFFTSYRKGLHGLLSPLKIWRVPAKWYVFAIAAPLVFWLSAYLLDLAFGVTYPLTRTIALPAAFIPILIFFSLPNALGEEIGWRGFLYPHLEKRYSQLFASLLVGICWAVWHLPTWTAQGISSIGQLPIFVSIVLASFLFSWLYINTKRSLLVVTIYHASTTLSGYFLPTIPTITPIIVSSAFLLYLCLRKHKQTL